MLRKARLYYYSLRYLRFEQVAFRILYLFRAKWWQFTGFRPYSFYLHQLSRNKNPFNFHFNLQMHPSVFAPSEMLLKSNRFCFLNIEQDFQSKIDWDFDKNGKLWTYNLNYFEFLTQKNISQPIALTLIYDFIGQLPQLKVAHEPFPISLRTIFWIRFFTRFNIPKQDHPLIIASLQAQVQVLTKSLERHLLGNHFLENGFALLFAAYFFEDKKLYTQAKWILEKELKEEILEDGGHFELSPMYHLLMTYRVLDCLNLINSNPSVFEDNLSVLLHQRAQKMMAWLQSIMFRNGDLPRFNDSVEGIAPTPKILLQYAQQLNISVQKEELSDSGYRKLENEWFELIVKTGNLAPDYIPGHAHANSLSFELHVQNQPIFINKSISTYEKNALRQDERSTKSNNTVVINGQNSSEVWGGFRVGKRARSKVESVGNQLICQHDGYAPIIHQRAFELKNQELQITDTLLNTISTQSVAFFYTHPSVTIKQVGDKLLLNEKLWFSCKKGQLAVSDTSVSMGFNHLVNSKLITVAFPQSATFILHYDSAK